MSIEKKASKIKTNEFNVFDIDDRTVTVDKISWTPILLKRGSDRRYIHIGINSTGDDHIKVSKRPTGENAISYPDIALMTNEHRYYNGALYAQVVASSVEETIDVVIHENDR